MNSELQFTNKIHRVGRLTVLACLIAFITLPVALSIVYKAPIDYGLVFSNGMPIFLSFTVVAISENLSYAPLIGPGALYTACVTGDLSNMKVPAAVNAMKILGVDEGSEKGNMASILAVTTCTFVTATIALAGMVFLAPIVGPIFENPYIKPAFDNLVPAIFGALLIPKLIQNPVQNIPIFALPIIIGLILEPAVFGKNQGYILIGCVVLGVIYSYNLVKKLKK